MNASDVEDWVVDARVGDLARRKGNRLRLLNRYERLVVWRSWGRNILADKEAEGSDEGIAGGQCGIAVGCDSTTGAVHHLMAGAPTSETTSVTLRA